MFDNDMRLHGWTNIETGELKGPISQFSDLDSQLRKLAFSGIHVFHPSLAPLLDEWPERFPIMDFYLKACGDNLIKGYEAKDLRLLDVGKLDTLEKAEEFVSL
jgi:NDP-sugar pyrophosphorylase family protein